MSNIQSNNYLVSARKLLNLKFRRHPHESGDLIVKGLEITLSEGFAVPSQAENDEKRSFLAETI
jgi:hypothetical protein